MDLPYSCRLAPADRGGGGNVTSILYTGAPHTILEKVIWGGLVMDLDLKRCGVEEIMC